MELWREEWSRTLIKQVEKLTDLGGPPCNRPLGATGAPVCCSSQFDLVKVVSQTEIMSITHYDCGSRKMTSLGSATTTNLNTPPLSSYGPIMAELANPDESYYLVGVLADGTFFETTALIW